MLQVETYPLKMKISYPRSAQCAEKNLSDKNAFHSMREIRTNLNHKKRKKAPKNKKNII
jgi:hypothetical protein